MPQCDKCKQEREEAGGTSTLHNEHYSWLCYRCYAGIGWGRTGKAEGGLGRIMDLITEVGPVKDQSPLVRDIWKVVMKALTQRAKDFR